MVIFITILQKYEYFSNLQDFFSIFSKNSNFHYGNGYYYF